MRRLPALLALCALGAAACNKSEASKTVRATAPQPVVETPVEATAVVPVVPVGCAGTAAASSGAAEAGKLAFDLAPTTVDPCSVAIVLVGAVTAPVLRVLADGSYEVSGAPIGTSDLIITGALTPTSDGPQPAVDLGARVNDVTIVASQTTKLPTVVIEPFGEISGHARLAGQTDFTGITVFVPGTQFAARTDASGAFSLKNLPKGAHDLVFEQANFHPARIGRLVVQAGAATTADDVLLVPNLGETGPLLLDPPGTASAPLRTLTVAYALFPAGKPVLMRLSEDGTFANVPARPFVSSGTFTFAADEALRAGGKASRRLFVQLTEGESVSVLEAKVEIDLFGGVDFALATPLLRAPAEARFTLTGMPPQLLPDTTMQIALTPTFSDAVATAPAPTYDLTLPAGIEACGEKTVYLRMTAPGGFVSATASHALTYECFRSMTLAGAPTSPSYGLRRLFSGRFFVWGGMVGGYAMDTGAWYDLATDTWADMGSTSAQRPSARTFPYAVWTGKELAVWGGMDGIDHLDSGALFDPATGLWRPMATANNPGPRSDAFVAAVGKKVLVWGGEDGTGALNTGAAYDTETGAWTALPTDVLDPSGTVVGTVPVYDRYAQPTLVGGRLVLFGGEVSGHPIATGAVYDPATGRWIALPTLGAPSPRSLHFTAAHGDRFYVLGGEGEDADEATTYPRDGAYFDLGDGAWHALPHDMPENREKTYSYDGLAKVLGGRLVIWGGYKNGSYEDTALVMDLSDGAWTKVDAAAGPPGDSPLYYEAFTANRFAVWAPTFEGVAGEVTERLRILDPATASWKRAPPFPLQADRDGAAVRGDDASDVLILWGGIIPCDGGGYCPQKDGIMIDASRL